MKTVAGRGEERKGWCLEMLRRYGHGDSSDVVGGEGKEELELSPGPVSWVSSLRGLHDGVNRGQ